jgi:hypothetical protein
VPPYDITSILQSDTNFVTRNDEMSLGDLSTCHRRENYDIEKKHLDAELPSRSPFRTATAASVACLI